MFTVYDTAKDAEEKAVKRASDNLKNRGDNTYSDEEIDSFLPIFLRKTDIKKGGN